MYNCILDQEVPPYRAIGQCKTLYCGMSSAKHFLWFKVHYTIVLAKLAFLGDLLKHFLRCIE